LAGANLHVSAGIEPELILPAQFFARPQRDAAWTGTRRLTAALLADALTVCSKPSRSVTKKELHVRRETMRWLRSNDRTWLFSFLRVCEALDLDPGIVRRSVLRRRDAAILAGALVAEAS